jgi:hypothetical protein
MGDARGQDAGLAGTGAGQDKHGALHRAHGGFLLRIKAGKKIGLYGSHLADGG